MSTRERVDAIYRDIKNAESELTFARGACVHPARKVVDYMWRAGAVQVKAICAECDTILGEPTPEERAGFKSMLDAKVEPWREQA